jgi:RNA-binding protein
MALSGKQKRYLRGLGVNLKPIVLVGQHGIDERVVTAIIDAVATHELIKVKLLENCVEDRHTGAEKLAAKTKTELVQVLGKTILLYKPAEEARIQLPA